MAVNLLLLGGLGFLLKGRERSSGRSEGDHDPDDTKGDDTPPYVWEWHSTFEVVYEIDGYEDVVWKYGYPIGSTEGHTSIADQNYGYHFIIGNKDHTKFVLSNGNYATIRQPDDYDDKTEKVMRFASEDGAIIRLDATYEASQTPDTTPTAPTAPQGPSGGFPFNTGFGSAPDFGRSMI